MVNKFRNGKVKAISVSLALVILLWHDKPINFDEESFLHDEPSFVCVEKLSSTRETNKSH